MDGHRGHLVNSSPDALGAILPFFFHLFPSVVVLQPGSGRIDKFSGLDFELLERVTAQFCWLIGKGFCPFGSEGFVIGAVELFGEVRDRPHTQIDGQLRNAKLFSKDIHRGGSHRPGKLGEALALELVQIFQKL